MHRSYIHNSVSLSKHAIHKTKTHVVGSIVINPQGSFFTIVIKVTTAAFGTHGWVPLQVSVNCIYYVFLCRFGSQVDILSL